jgi:predicted nuclease of predicted toxin-antitoxin system
VNILADENIEAPSKARLRLDGHIVTAISAAYPGISDTAVLQRAIQLQVLLVTGDNDFGDLLFLWRLQAPIGLILTRLPESMTASQKADVISEVLYTHAARLVGLSMQATVLWGASQKHAGP